MNRRHARGWAWSVLAAALATGAAACGPGDVNKAGSPAAQTIVLTLADGEGSVANALPFAEAVMELSGGALQIKVKSHWRPDDPRYETGLIKDVQRGDAQLGVSSSRAFDTVGISSFQALQAPFLIDNIALEQKVLDSDIPSRMLAGLKPHGLVGLAVLAGPLRRPLGFTGPLVAPSKYRGASIGFRASEVSDETLRALGATPVVLPRDNDASGLDGVVGHVTNMIDAFKVRGATLTGNVVIEPRPNVIFMNQRAFGALSAAQQRVLIRAASQARAEGGVYEPDGTSVQQMCRGGITIVTASRVDLAGLAAAVQPVYRKLESNPATKAFIAQITAMRQAVGGAPDAVSCPAGSGGASQITTTSTKLDDEWQVTFTEGQLLAAGPEPGEDQPENYGHFMLTLERGHWRQVGPGRSSGVITNYGTYLVSGDKITFYRSDHEYPGSDTEIWGPYFWSVYRDTLTLKKAGWSVRDQGPTSLVVKPWRKIGT
jgi:TRAP-type C4-dicarboxylate transport system substrate-binding protein